MSCKGKIEAQLRIVVGREILKKISLKMLTASH
jgi:hypothetical protein